MAKSAKEPAYELWSLGEHRHAVVRDGRVLYVGSVEQCEQRLAIHRSRLLAETAAARDQYLRRAVGA